jgi:hypothetical protein
LKSVLLPTLGRPTITTRGSLAAMGSVIEPQEEVLGRRSLEFTTKDTKDTKAHEEALCTPLCSLRLYGELPVCKGFGPW